MAVRFRLFSRFPRCAPSHKARQGATAVEMAMVAPIFFLLMIGMVELSLIMLTQHLMENTAFNASRLAATGTALNGQTQLQTITNLINQELGSLTPLIDTNQISLSFTSYGSLNQVGVNGQGANTLGTASQIVVYTISYPWKLFTPMFGALMGTNGILTLSSRIVVQNEPF